MAKKRQKLDFKKLVKLTGSYLCLHKFDRFWIWSTSNDRKWKVCESAELAWKNSWNHIMYFWADFSQNPFLPVTVLKKFEYEGQAITGHGNYVNLLKLDWKKSWNHIKQIYFWRILETFGANVQRNGWPRRQTSFTYCAGWSANDTHNRNSSRIFVNSNELYEGTHICKVSISLLLCYLTEDLKNRLLFRGRWQ